MEEKDIKDIWKSGDPEEIKGYPQAAVDAMVRRGSIGLIDRFIKTLKIEQWLNLAAFSGLILFMIYCRLWAWSGLALVLNIAFYFYYSRLISTLSNEKIDSSVIEYLRTVRKVVMRFIRHYQLASVLLVVPGYMLGMYFSQIAKETDNTAVAFTIEALHIVGIVCTLGVALVLIHLIYGRKANQINELITALGQEED